MKVLQKIARVFRPVHRDEKHPPVETLLLHSEARRLAQARSDQERAAAELLKQIVCRNNKEAGR